MSDIAGGITEFLSFNGDKGRSRALCEAAMAAAALVATARSGVTFAERALIDQALRALADEGEASSNAGIEMFQYFVDAISANSSRGRRDALAAVQDCPAHGRDVVLRIATAMAHANGQPTPESIAIAGEIAIALGVVPPNAGGAI